MKTRLLVLLVVACLVLCGCVIQPIQPEAAAAPPAVSEEEAALAVVEAFNTQTSAGPLSMENIDAFMEFYADDCDYIVAGLPREYNHLKGKQAIRDYYIGADVQIGTVFNFEPLAVEGSQVVAHNRSTSEVLAQYGAGEFDGVEVFVVKDGKFVADYYMASAETNQTFARLNNVVLSPDDAEAAIVKSAVAPWVGEGVTATTVDESLKWYADDAKFMVLGLPTGVEIYEGKEALRPLMEAWVEMHQRWEVEPLTSEGNIVVTRSRTWLDPTVELGIAPIEATEMWIVKDGLIQEEIWAITPGSLEQLMAALGAALPAEPPAEAAPAAPAMDTSRVTRELTQEEKDAVAVVEEWAALFEKHPMTLETLDEFMALYADDATLINVPPDGGSWPVHIGKNAITTYFVAHDASDASTAKHELLNVEGNRVTVRVIGSGEWEVASKSPPFVGIETFVVKDGKIHQDTWVWEPASMAGVLEVIAKHGHNIKADASPSTRLDAIKGALGPASSGPLTAEGIDESLKFYADDAVFMLLGLPGGPQVHEGKEAIRGLMQTWVDTHMHSQFEPILAEGTGIAGRSYIWDDGLEAMGIAPLEATEYFVVNDNLIVRDVWAITPDSLEQLLGAIGQ